MACILDAALNLQHNYTWMRKRYSKSSRIRKNSDGNRYTMAVLHVLAHSLTTSQNTINGIVFYSRVIILIWQAVIAQWKVRNQHQHPPNRTEEDCTQLECRVYQIIQEAQADPNMQELITSVNPNVLLNRPIKHIRHWITNSKNHMQAQQKVASIWASLHMQDIWTFFQRPPTYRNKIPQRKTFYAPLRKSYISSVGLRKLWTMALVITL